MKKIKKNPAELQNADVRLPEKLIRLLGLLLVKGEPQPDKIRLLANAGFSNSDIAVLLSMTPNAVNIALYKMRSKKK